MVARRTLSSLRAAVAGLVSSLTRSRTGNAARAEAGGPLRQAQDERGDEAPGDCFPFFHPDHAAGNTRAEAQDHA
jgi:hypothetical protein